MNTLMQFCIKTTPKTHNNTINKKMFRVIIPLVHDLVKPLPPTKEMIELDEFRKEFKSSSEEIQIKFILWISNRNLLLGTEPDEIKNLCSLIYKSTAFLDRWLQDIESTDARFPMDSRFSFYLREIRLELAPLTSTQFDDLIVTLTQISSSTVIEIVKSIYCRNMFIPHPERGRILSVGILQSAERNRLIAELQRSEPWIQRVLLHHQQMEQMILLHLQQLSPQLIQQINAFVELKKLIQFQLKYLPRT